MGVAGLPSAEAFLPVASTSRLMDTDDVTGAHTLPQEDAAAAGVMPHMRGGGLGPCLALYASPSSHMMRWMSLMKPCWGPITEPGRQTRM